MAQPGEPRRGEIRPLNAEGAASTHVLVISEDDWNRWARDVVGIPLDGALPAHPPTRPIVATVIGGSSRSADLAAQCDRALQVPVDVLGAPVEARLAPRWSEDVTLAMQQLMAIGQPLGSRKPPTGSRTGRWWPRQGQVVYGPSYGGERKMVAVITEDEWNVNHDYALVVRLTSQSKGRSSAWYVPITGGWLATPDVLPFPYARMDQRTRPPVHALSAEEFALLTERIAQLWGLGTPSGPGPALALGF